MSDSDIEREVSFIRVVSPCEVHKRKNSSFRAACKHEATLMHTLPFLSCRKRGCQTLMLLPSTRLQRKLSTVSLVSSRLLLTTQKAEHG